MSVYSASQKSLNPRTRKTHEYSLFRPRLAHLYSHINCFSESLTHANECERVLASTSTCIRDQERAIKHTRACTYIYMRYDRARASETKHVRARVSE